MFRLISVLVLGLVVALSAHALEDRAVSFVYNDRIVKLYTIKFRSKMPEKDAPDIYGGRYIASDEFLFQDRQFFIGSLFLRGQPSIFRKGVFQVVDGRAFLMLGPGDGFSIEYEGERFVFIHPKNSSGGIMESRLYHLTTNGFLDLLSFDLLTTMPGLIVHDAIVDNKKILVSGVCYGSEFAFEMSFDSKFKPKVTKLLEQNDRSVWSKGDCNEYIKDFDDRNARHESNKRAAKEAVRLNLPETE